MLATSQAEFIELFDIVDDPREDEKTTYPVNEILFLIIAAVLSGAESWRNIIEYGNKKIALLRQFLPYINGIPSRFTIMRFMSALDKRRFEMFLNKWSSELLDSLQDELVAIDGKALRGARKLDREENSVYLLNAFATKQGMVIGQMAIDTKNNEITAIPKLLDELDITGAIVSIDAIVCQKNIAKKIVNKGCDYFLALKANQETLHKDVKDFFANIEDKSPAKIDFCETHDKGHGRVESRKCWSTDDIEWLKLGHPGWQNLTSICCIEASRYIDGVEQIKKRYYISCTQADAKKHLAYSRNHWSIENNLHWELDVVFKEDDSLIRAHNAAQNMGAIRKMVLNLIKSYKSETGIKTGISTLRLSAGWDDSTASSILSGLRANRLA